MSPIRFHAWVLVCLGWAISCSAAQGEDVPPAVRNWLGPQEWKRDLDEPTLSLGPEGEFDDQHMFAPTVVQENGRYFLWYCGSTGTAIDVSNERVPDNRLFKLGLATSDDGLHFKRREKPVMELKDPARSILTPCILRSADGAPVREDGKLRMWFTSNDFHGKSGGHVIQQSSSADGITWAEPTAPEIQKAYAPAVIKDGNEYRMWYVDVRAPRWSIRHARSKDGRTWDDTPDPVLELDQPWEARILVYPCVIKVDDCYLMWYGSYLDDGRQKTAIGFAASQDGIHWFKHPHNPVVSPREDRPWESHYVGNASVIRLPGGKFRMWYGSRKAPPFRNLYFAINSATWDGPAK